MARPREFDQDTVIDKAMQVFWKYGYEGASLPDLLKGMGLTRGSFYKAFGDKRSLFLMALDRYDAQEITVAVTNLRDPAIPDGRDRIAAVFDKVTRAALKGDRRGCLMCSASAGPASDDPDVAKAVNLGLNRMEAGFVAALQASPAHKSRDSSEIEGLAGAVTAQYVGVRILARSQVPLSALSHTVAGISTILHRPET